MDIDADLRRKTLVSAAAVGIFLVLFTVTGAAFATEVTDCGNASSMELTNSSNASSTELTNSSNASSTELTNSSNASSTGPPDCGITFSPTGGFAVVGALAGFVLLMAVVGVWLDRNTGDNGGDASDAGDADPTE